MNSVSIAVTAAAVDALRLRDTMSSLAAHTPASARIWPAPASPSPFPAPLSPAASFGRMVREHSSDLYVLLEAGVIVGPGWMDRLLAALEADPRNGLAGPSTNRSWNEQCAFPGAGGSPAEIARTAADALHRFGADTRTLEPLYSLAAFCYVVRREVIADVGLPDEGYGDGPCWEMDYNIRAARAGWRGVWAGSSYVFRPPASHAWSQREHRFFAGSKRRYQDKFCGARLRGAIGDYRTHCRGDACPNFAPAALIRILEPATEPPRSEPPAAAPVSGAADSAPPPAAAAKMPLVTCIMPTCDRHEVVPDAIRCFLAQDYPNLELLVLDDGATPVAPLIPADPRIRVLRLPSKRNIGAKRNIACREAGGTLIVHWDDDDWYPPDRVSRQVEALRPAETAICGTSTLYYLHAGDRRAWRYRYHGSGRLWVAGNTLAYRKSWWEQHPFPEIQVGEDARFVWSAPRGAVRDLAAPGLCVARVHAGNTSRKLTAGPCWQPCAVEEVAAVLGDGWSAFARPAAATAPALPLVSCIMPTHNRRAFLPLALRAYAAQDYAARELVVVDDGTDPVDDLLAGVAGVRYLRLAGKRPIGEKRNLACEEARGEIIAHWDDDDWYAPSRLSEQVAPLLAGEADLTGLENSFVLELPAGQFWRAGAALHRRMFVGDVHGGTLIYRKKILARGVRYPAVSLAEDAALLKAALGRGWRLRRLPNPGLFVYMRHGGNAWKFQSGRFLDPQGWESIGGPATFSPAELATWQDAAGRTPAGIAAGKALELERAELAAASG